MIALCEYELAPPFAKAASRQGLVAIRVHDSTADYTDSQRGVAGVDPVTYAFGIARACSRDRIVVLKRLRRSLAAGCCCGEQAERCLRTHPYLDPPHLRPRDAGISPSAAFRTLAARTAADEDDCDTRHESEPSHPGGRLAPLRGHSGTLAHPTGPSAGGTIS
jgi:hypothetical protein